MNDPRSELLADDVCLRKNRSLLLLGLFGFILSFVGGWLMFSDDSGEPVEATETVREEF